MDRWRPHPDGKGFDGLAALMQTALAENLFRGHLSVFRDRRGVVLKVLWFDGQSSMRLAKIWAYARGEFDAQQGVIYEFCLGRGSQYPVC